MSLSCSHCMGRGTVRRNDGEKKCQLCGGLGEWAVLVPVSSPDPYEPCQYCADTGIDAEVLRRFDMVSPCRYCCLPPDRKEETEDHIISEVLNEELNEGEE